MRKFKTDEICVVIELIKNEEKQTINIIYTDQDGKTLEENIVSLPTKICKQSFNDAKLSQNIINFFIKD